MEFPRLVIALLRVLLLIAHLWAVTHGASAPPNLSKDLERAVRLDRETTTQSSLSSTIEERRGLQLIKTALSALKNVLNLHKTGDFGILTYRATSSVIRFFPDETVTVVNRQRAYY